MSYSTWVAFPGIETKQEEPDVAILPHLAASCAATSNFLFHTLPLVSGEIRLLLSRFES